MNFDTLHDIVLILCPLLLIGVRKPNRLVSWILVIHLCVWAVICQLLVYKGWIEYTEPYFFLVYAVWSFICCQVLMFKCHLNKKTPPAFLVILLTMVYALCVFFEYYASSSVFYDAYPGFMVALSIYQLYLIAKDGYLGQRITSHIKSSSSRRRDSVNDPLPHNFCNPVYIPGKVRGDSER